MRRRLIPLIIPFLLLGTLSAWAQDCDCLDSDNCPLSFGTNFTGQVCYDVTDAFNDDLSDPAQGVCGVSLTFTHTHIWDLELSLTSPDGTTVDLIGPNTNAFGTTNNVVWNILMIPCSGTAQPDEINSVLFDDVWTNDQVWPFAALFEGSYYPVAGNCLEDFNTGVVNGTWCLNIDNAPSTFSGEIINFEVILCDNSGILCCEADGGDLSDFSPLDICEGNDTLLLDYIFPDYGLIGPDPISYGYTYLVVDATGVLLEVNDIPDLTAYASGSYSVYGLSYRLDGILQLPVPDGILTITDIDANLNGGAPDFCGEISNDPIDVTIYGQPGITMLTEIICQGDSIVVGDSTFFDTGSYQVDLLTPFACDSVVSLDLTVLMPDTTDLVETICFGEVFPVGDSIYIETGNYQTLLQNQFGCDSLVILDLTELPLLETFLVDTICIGESVEVGTSTYSTTGMYTDLLLSADGCDSTVFLDLLVLDLDVTIDPATLVDCFNPTQTLTAVASGFGTLEYLWETTDGAILSGIDADTILIGSGGTYTLTISAAGCSEQASIVVDQDLNFPTADAGATNFITCANDSIQLDGSASTSGPNIAYEWFTFNGNILSGETSISPWVDMDGIYFLGVTDLTNGCADTTSVFILNNLTPPFAEAGPNDSLTCEEPLALLDGSASLGGSNLSYFWADSLGNALPFNANIEATTEDPGWYYLTVTNLDNGCTATDSAQIIDQFVFPVVDAGPTDTLNCVDTTLELDGSGSDEGPEFSYLWTGPVGGILGPDDILNPEVAIPGMYFLNVTSSLTGCIGMDSVLIEIDTLAPIAVTDDQFTLNCDLLTVTLGNAGGSSTGPNISYQWLDEDLMVVSSTLTFVVDQAGDYILVVTNDQNGCTAQDTTLVEADLNVPMAVVGLPGVLTCDDPVFTLDGTGSTVAPGVTYSWENDLNIEIGDALTQDISTPGTYCLIVANGLNFCQDTACVTITQDASLPTVEAGPDQELDCMTGQATLQATTTGIGGDFAYAWTTLDGNIVGDTAQISALVDGVGTYYFSVTDTINGCSVLDSAQVTLDTASCFPQAFAGPNGLVNCYTFPFDTLDASFGTTAGPNISYEWSVITGAITGPNDEIQVVVDTGTYVLTVTNTTFGFSDMDTVQVIADLDPPIADAGDPISLDCQTITAGFQLDGTGSSSGAGILYDWSTGVGGTIQDSTTTTPTINQPGIYDLLVTDALNGCFAVDAVLVTLDGNLPSVCLPDAIQIPCGDTSAVIVNSCGDPAYEYVWTAFDGDIIGGNNLDSVEVYPLVAPALVAVEVTDPSNSCVVNDTLEVFPPTACFPDCNILLPDTLTCDQTLVTLDGTGSSVGLEFTYEWIVLTDGNLCGGENTLQACADAPGTYRLTVVDTVTNFACTQDVVVAQDTVAPVFLTEVSDSITCSNQAVTLTGTAQVGTGPFTYNWTSVNGTACFNTDIDLNTVEVSCPGDYQLEVIDQDNGCVATFAAEVVLDTLAPVVVLNEIGTLTCENPDTTLSALGSSLGLAMQYTWFLNNVMIDSGVNLQEITINEPGIYCLEITNLETGCSNEECTEVMQDIAVPMVDAGPDREITCEDTLLTIQGVGPADPTLEITWAASMGGCILGPNDQLAMETNCPGTYTLTVTDPSTGCSGTSSMVVTLNNDPPFANAGPDLEINCLETVIMLDGSQSDMGPNISYSWSALFGNIVSGENTNQPTVDSAGIYELVVTDGLTGCTDTSFAFVNEVLNLPLIDIDDPEPLTCTVLEVILDGSGSAQGDSITYDWATVTGGNIVNGTSASQATVNAAGVYSLTVTNTVNGCSVTEEIAVSIDTLAPSAIITLGNGDELSCLTPELLLDASLSEPTGFLFFEWSTNNGSIISGVNGMEIEVDSAGSYQLLVENIQNGCIDSTSQVVSADFSAPNPEIALPGVLTCIQDSILLDASGSLLPTNYSVLWSAESSSAVISPIDALISTVVEAGVYQVLLTDLETGCADSTQVEVIANITPPVVNASVSDDLDCEELVVSLSAVGSSEGLGFIYQWSLGGAVVDSSFTVPVSLPGIYELAVFNGQNGCSDTATVEVIQLTDPIDFMYLDIRPPSCLGAGNGRIVIDSVEGGTPPFLYSFEDQPFAEYIWYDFLDTGVYPLSVEDANGCTLDTLVSIIPPEDVLVDLGPDVFIQLGETVDLQALVSLPIDSLARITWSPLPDPTGCLDCLEYTVAPTDQVTYWIEVENQFGCTATDALTIFVETELPIYMPTVFSPNGDGENDIFFVQSGPAVAEIERFLIFDRWGNLVHEGRNFLPNDPNFGWDGDFERRPVNSQVFVWMIELRYQNGQRAIFRGDLTILR